MSAVRHRVLRTASVALLEASLAVGAAAATVDDGLDDPDARPAAVPYRPTVSTPAQLSAPGWVELEVGGLRAVALVSPVAGRTSVPYSVKLAWSDDWGVRVGGEAFARRSDDGSATSGFGDTTVVLKRRFAIDEGSAFGLEAGATAPTARRGVGYGSGKPDYGINGIFSSDFASTWHTDVNVVGTRLGGRDPGTGRYQTLAAWSVSDAIAANWTAAFELSGARQRAAPGTAQALAALSDAVRRDVVLDCGFARGLNRATPTWQVFAGATIVVGRLF